MHFKDIHSAHFFQNETTLHPTTPPPPLRLPQKWSSQQIVEFPLSHISFVMQHVLHVPVIRNYNISGRMHVLCIILSLMLN